VLPEGNCAMAELKGLVSKPAVKMIANLRICLSSGFDSPSELAQRG
jgi:hypothetical protein